MPGDLVIDIGANVGMFSSYASEQAGRTGAVIAAEPIPTTFQALQHNVSLHFEYSKHSRRPCAPVKCLQVGVSDGCFDTAVFTDYPKAGGWGTMTKFESPGAIYGDMEIFIDNALDEDSSALPPLVRGLGTLLREASPTVFKAIAQAMVQRMLSGSKQCECKLITVSDIIENYLGRRHGVGLLKVDVERAEIEVLSGIQPKHWRLIRQASLEVHAENLNCAVEILRGAAGFESVEIEQGQDLRGTSIHHIYCHRILN